MTSADDLWLGNRNQAGRFRRYAPFVMLAIQIGVLLATSAYGNREDAFEKGTGIPYGAVVLFTFGLWLTAVVGLIYEVLTPPRSVWRRWCYLAAVTPIIAALLMPALSH